MDVRDTLTPKESVNVPIKLVPISQLVNYQ